jgi:hypothetical protein
MMKGCTLHEPEWYFSRGKMPPALRYRFQIKRKWDEISDRGIDLLGKHGLIRGTVMAVVSIELSLDHEMTVEMVAGMSVDAEDSVPLKQVFRSIRRHYC